MRFWTVVAALTLLAAAAARADDSALAQARAQTFVVQVAFGPEHGEIGAGVLVDRDGDVLTIVTAAHIVTQHGTLEILDTTRRNFYHVLNIRTLPDYDLAFIRVQAQDTFAVTPASIAPPRAGEPIWVWGHTGNAFWKLATGSVRDTSAHIPGLFGSPRITIDCAACAHGDSGSGVFDAQGQLLGIVTRAWSKKGGGPILYIEVEPAALIRLDLVGEGQHHLTLR